MSDTDLKLLARTLVPAAPRVDDARKYSITRAATAHAEGRQIRGLEGETHAELARCGHVAGHGGFLVPFDFGYETRDQAVATGAAGAYLVGNRPLAIGDALRQRSLVFAAGVQQLRVPGESSAVVSMTAIAGSWISTETTAASSADPTFSSRTLVPKQFATRATISRRLALQNPLLADSLLAADLGASIATGVDAAVIAGDGTNGAPTGVLSTAGIGAMTGASFNWAAAVNGLRDLESANAIFDPRAVCYFADPASAETLRARFRTGGTTRYVVEGDDADGWRIGPHRCFASSNVPASTVIVGDWSRALVVTWSAIEVVPDPFTGATSGKINFTAWVSCDVAIRNPESFSAATSVS